MTSRTANQSTTHAVGPASTSHGQNWQVQTDSAFPFAVFSPPAPSPPARSSASTPASGTRQNTSSPCRTSAAGTSTPSPHRGTPAATKSSAPRPSAAARSTRRGTRWGFPTSPTNTLLRTAFSSSTRSLWTSSRTPPCPRGAARGGHRLHRPRHDEKGWIAPRADVALRLRLPSRLRGRETDPPSTGVAPRGPDRRARRPYSE